MNSKYTSISKWASYRGRRVWLTTRNEEFYFASFYVDNHPEGMATDWMINMRHGGKGEYNGQISVDDPDLCIED